METAQMRGGGQQLVGPAEVLPDDGIVHAADGNGRGEERDGDHQAAAQLFLAQLEAVRNHQARDPQGAVPVLMGRMTTPIMTRMEPTLPIQDSEIV